ncbi:hypothetical protein [Aureliella helgolandensis]|uniref:hypothetical protein n=1 Tax=Aureliella helgolandensis TaxID=2527968 RepID=UPI0018D052CE|nr:hypothetical protein [Aureliella helgolandensis]
MARSQREDLSIGIPAIECIAPGFASTWLSIEPVVQTLEHVAPNVAEQSLDRVTDANV